MQSAFLFRNHYQEFLLEKQDPISKEVLNVQLLNRTEPKEHLWKNNYFDEYHTIYRYLNQRFEKSKKDSVKPINNNNQYDKLFMVLREIKVA